ncbi:MAG TPA: esterase-like activity of phytase family protein [Candidatus Binatia bacterium]|nr:esterase-like activity of phytase family protein [Candidatus Binatia bacterium]
MGRACYRQQFLGLVCVSALFLSSCALRTPLANGRIVEAVPIELDLTIPGQERFGSLTFVSGFELKSSDSRFGGLSGLVVTADGSKLYAVSDRGYWISASLHHDAAGRLTGFEDWEIAPLLNLEGSPVSGRDRDAEALARDHDGSFIVCFEQRHRLWRYPSSPTPLRAAAQKVQTPDELTKAPANGGPEAIAVLPDGGLFVMTEEYENADGSLKGWLIEKDQFVGLSYLSSDRLRPVDAAALTSGDVLVLERRFSLFGGWDARVRRLSRDSLHAGIRLEGEEIARLVPPLPLENFEGMAVWEHPQAGTFLYLVSDDNYNPFQRTLLLQFRLE